MQTNDLSALLRTLEQQRSEAAARNDDLTRQLSAALRRAQDLQQQLAAAQEELGKLTLMQLGKKMMVRAEQENIRKKLAVNQQLQDSLTTRLSQCASELSGLERKIAEAEAALAAGGPGKAAGPAEVPSPVAEASLPAAEASPPAAEAPISPREPRASRAPRRPRPNPALSPEEQIALLLPRLEALYPERKVFLLDNLCPELSARLSALAQAAGCPDVRALLAQHGFTLITGAQGRALHSGRYCTPGEEPEAILPLLRSVLRRLGKHYPGHVITRSLQHDHKSLAQDVSSLYQWLGYANAGEMLSAYGYRYEVGSGGRPATDVHRLLETIREGYAEGAKPRTIAQVMADYPKLAHSIKTLQNQSSARFGMPLKQYLAEQGILAPRDKTNT